MLWKQQLQEAAEQFSKGTVPKVEHTQAKLAVTGEAMLNMGIIPDKPYLDALGIDEATARGFQSIIWMGLEDNPQAQQTMEMVIDLAASEKQEDEYEQTSDVVHAEEATYSPVNPGPLIEEYANTFNGATYTMKELTEDTIMYRVSGGNAGKVGSFMTRIPQNGGLQSQLDLALKPEWGNTAENVRSVIVPRGMIVYEGTVAPQDIHDSRGNVIGTLPGGGNQIYIPYVEDRWFQ